MPGTPKERLHQLVDELPEAKAHTALHVLGFLCYRARGGEPLDSVRAVTCPECGALEHELTEETIRALEEMRAGIDVKRYASLNEMWRDLGI